MSQPVANVNKMSQPVANTNNKAADGATGRKAKTMKYIVTKTIGKGAFGVVYLAREEKSETIYAIKETFQDPNYKNREAEIVKRLDHPNIIKVHHIFFSKKAKGTYLHLVMDHLPSNLFEYIQKTKKAQEIIEPSIITDCMYQILRGVGYLHSQGVCHRDIKPHNILIDPATLRVAVCDFGSAKGLVANEWNKTYICSRFYRAPELLFQSNYYTTAVDVWSVGCVMGELYRLSPIFAAADTDGQIASVANVLGAVGRDHIKVFRLESCKKIPSKKVNWAEAFWRSGKDLSVPESHSELLSAMLTYDCVSRVNAFDALKLDMFDSVREMMKSSDFPAERMQYFAMTSSEKKRAMEDNWDAKYVM